MCYWKSCYSAKCGEIQLPLNNLGVMALDFISNKGIATSIGFSPIVSLADEKIGEYSILSL